MAELLAAVSVVFALLVLSGFYLSWRAGRLDRLHTRVETAQAALDAALERRGAVVLELASAAELEPASSVLLADAAGKARRATDRAARELAESNLSRALRAVVDQPGFTEAMAAGRDPAGDDLLAEVEAAAKRVHLARRFYNDGVASIREARSSRLVSVFRLAGHAPMPEFFEMDDEPPAWGRGA
ncbi:membrane protein [Nocardiopsis rhodophaea]|uniref:Membrane protein n=1 Tax=Nocardiopsis rhodophaea TaxID=280238 RepID=A0ABN2STC8_9ACTN